MDIRHKLDEKHGIRTQKVRGSVTLPGLLEYLKQLYASEGFDPGTKVIWDFREADLSELKLADVVSVRNHIEKDLQGTKPTLAALIVANQTDYSLTAMFETLISGPDVSVKIFFSLDDARDWLNGKVFI